MTVDRQRGNFEGNIRVDIPDFRAMLDRAFDDFRFLVKTYIDNGARRVVKRYQQGTHAGLVFKLKKDENRAFHDSNQEWIIKSPDSPGSTLDTTLADNTTNYVEVRVDSFTDDLQTRAFWDTDIGLTGEEYFDDINVRRRLDDAVQSNTSGFTPGAVPLFIVVTSAGSIDSVTPADDLLWKNRAIALPAASSRVDIFDDLKDLRLFIDFLGAIVGEVKGTGQAIESMPWSSLKLLREYQNLMFLPGSPVQWEGTAGADTLEWTSDIEIAMAGRAQNYLVPADSLTLLDGECVYVDIPETGPGPLAPVVSPLTSVPVNPTDVGHSPRIVVLFYRKGTRIAGAMDIPELDSGETAVIGQDLPSALRTRLGITGENSYQAYTSTAVIDSADTYPEAISKLDNEVGALQNNEPKEEYFSGDGVTTQFTVSSFTFSTDNTKKDNIVSVDGRGQNQSETGALAADRHYRKISISTVDFFSPPGIGSVVKIRKEGTTYGGPAAPSAGNLWSDPVDSNILPPDLGFNLGSSLNRFNEGHIDTLTVGKLVYRETLANLSDIKIKVNGHVAVIPAGKVVSIDKLTGGIFPADSDASTGKNMFGIALEAIASAGSGRVMMFGRNIPGVLVGSGFAPGDKVYIDENGNYVNNSAGFTGGDDEIVFVGWADCTEGIASTIVTDLIMKHQIILAAP